MKKIKKYFRILNSFLFLEIRTNSNPIIIFSLGRGGSTLLSEYLTKVTCSRLVFEPLHPKKLKQARYFKYPEFFCINQKSKNTSIWTDFFSDLIVLSGLIVITEILYVNLE